MDSIEIFANAIMSANSIPVREDVNDMADFQKRLCDFLGECKNDALLELGENKAYTAWSEKCSALYASLTKLMPPECLELLKQYQEAASAMSGIESDYCYLCAIRDYLRIGKQFDTQTDDVWSDFVSHMIPDPAETQE